MKNIIETLESIGQSVSIKQFSTFGEMKNNSKISESVLEKIEKIQSDLICAQEPEDDEE